MFLAAVVQFQQDQRVSQLDRKRKKEKKNCCEVDLRNAIYLILYNLLYLSLSYICICILIHEYA